MITPKSIHEFYQQYRKNLAKANGYEQTLLSETETKEQWVVVLKQKSQGLRALFEETEALLEEILNPILRGEVALTLELVQAILDEISQMCMDSIADSTLTIQVLQAIRPFCEEQNDRDLLITLYFYLTYNFLEENTRQSREGAFEISEKLLAYREQYEKIENPVIRRRILASLHNMPLSIPLEQTIFQPLRWRILVLSLDFFEDERIQALPCNDFPLEAICQDVFMQILLECEKPKTELDRHLPEYQEMKERRRAFFATLKEIPFEQMPTSLFRCYKTYQLQHGEISKSEYYDALKEMYLFQHSNIVTPLSKDEGISQIIQIGITLLPSLLRYAKLFEPEFYPLMLEQIQEMILSVPYGRELSAIDTLISNMVMTLVPFIEKEEMVDFFFLNIVLSRQVNTAIHVKMVEDIGNIVLTEVLNTNPALCIGLCDTKTAEDVQNNQEKIKSFISHCAIYHDIGKIILTKEVNMQMRRLNDVEYHALLTHAAEGAEVISSIPTLKKYEDVAYGHHKFYDGTGGYPESFDNTKSPIKFAIDLITICDCLDAATDILGRNYAKGKSFDSVLIELKQESGTRYSPAIVSLLENSPSLQEKLRYAVTLGREQVYFDVYQKHIGK